ncbi:hypothetical protein HDU92_004481, partial [Lobulomyces angularis]
MAVVNQSINEITSLGVNSFTHSNGVASFDKITPKDFLASCTIFDLKNNQMKSFRFINNPKENYLKWEQTCTLFEGIPTMSSKSFYDLVQKQHENLPISSLVSITSKNNMEKSEQNWSSFLSENTLFIKISRNVSFDAGFGFKDSICSVLELAEEVIGAENIVICLDKEQSDLSGLLRSFMFIGFELIHPSVLSLDNFVLLGYQ